MSIGNDLVTQPCHFKPKAYHILISELRFIFYKILYIKGLGLFDYFGFLLIYKKKYCAKRLRNKVFTLHHQNEILLKFWKTDFSQNIRQAMLECFCIAPLQEILLRNMIFFCSAGLKVRSFSIKFHALYNGGSIPPVPFKGI